MQIQKYNDGIENSIEYTDRDYFAIKIVYL